MFFAMAAWLVCGNLLAQVPQPIEIVGYVTAVSPKGSFEVEGTYVETRPNTFYGLIGGKNRGNDSSLRSRLRVGAYVRVTDDPKTSSRLDEIAAKIMIRDDWEQPCAGLGVIVKVISSGAHPVFEADGYHIRITPATRTTFAGGVKSLTDVHTDAWVKYAGKLDRNGVLIADKAQFFVAKPAKDKPLTERENSILKFRPPSSGPDVKGKPAGRASLLVDFPKDGEVLTHDGEIRLGLMHRSHTIPADNALQSRIRRVGMSLVPAYQKQLAADDPAKIPFHFYAIDAKKICCAFIPFDGLILVPVHAVARLKNDDQLAAILADPVAYVLQRQRERVAAANQLILGTDVAGYIAGAFVPGMSLVSIVGDVEANRVNKELYKERARIGLALMADAGYDLRQAPEAWRLILPKKLPKDLSELTYPDYSKYELNILNLQYTPAGTGAPAKTADN